jgi:hypothetical protein
MKWVTFLIAATTLALMGTCFPCHNQAKARDLVFTRYAP